VLADAYAKLAKRAPCPRTPPTEEAMSVDAAGHPEYWVEGCFLSRKITTPEDWEWAEWTLARIEKGTIHLED
jgi:2-C-methyl-D-erythritol 4-phosphate cytidylyltransferase